MPISYLMRAEENYDPAHVAAIAALTTYDNNILCTDQNYQGIQWDAVRRNLMYIYAENTVDTPVTNTTGHTLWDGATAIAPDEAIDPSLQFNSSVGVKNIDSGEVTFFLNYDSTKLVPAGIGGGDGTWRRYTNDFQAIAASSGNQNNGPGMTDPYTGNFWVNGESCELYCFRLDDNYAQVISPLRPVIDVNNIVQIIGFNAQGPSGPWSYAREINQNVIGDSDAHLYLTPRYFTNEEITADELLTYATFTYPTTGPGRTYHSYNREIFDHAGNMYLMTCAPVGDKNFTLYKFAQPTSAPHGGPVVGGGFTDITPWGSSTGPNADAVDYVNDRNATSSNFETNTGSVIPLYMPATDDLVLIEKFFPAEYTEPSFDPAKMFWSCTYVNDPAGTPTFDHHSAFVTGYMTSHWVPTDIDGAAYAVMDAFEVNNYLGQSDYSYDIDSSDLYTKKWFFFLCTKMTAGVSDGKARIVLVEYSFVNGAAPVVLQVIDEQGWDDAYPAFADHVNDAYSWTTGGDAENTAAVATAMQTFFNTDQLNPLWDSGVYDPETKTFWWSGGGTDSFGVVPFFTLFDGQFDDRAQELSGTPGTGGDEQLVAATPPFLRLSFSGEESDDLGDLTIRCWAFSLDDHDFYVLRLGPSETLIYDLKTEQWSSWNSPDRTNWRLHVGQNWVGYTDMGDNNTDIIAGDDTHGVLWILNAESGLDERPDDSGIFDPFTRVVTGGVQVVGRNNIPCGAVTIDVALGAPVSIDTTIELEISDNLGHSWVNCGSVTIPSADFGKVIEWRALGTINAPGRLFRFTDEGASVRISGANMR